MAADLTDRQREVLALMVEGDTNAEIARALWLSSDTVRYHVARICGALGARNRTHAVALSLRGDAAVAAILIDSIADELHARGGSFASDRASNGRRIRSPPGAATDAVAGPLDLTVRQEDSGAMPRQDESVWARLNRNFETFQEARREHCLHRGGSLRCVECGRPDRDGEKGWRVYLTIDDQVAVYCPACASDELGDA